MELASVNAEVGEALKDPHPPDPIGVGQSAALTGQRVEEEGSQPSLDQHQCGPHTHARATQFENGGGGTQPGMTLRATGKGSWGRDFGLERAGRMGGGECVNGSSPDQHRSSPTSSSRAAGAPNPSGRLQRSARVASSTSDSDTARDRAAAEVPVGRLDHSLHSPAPTGTDPVLGETQRGRPVPNEDSAEVKVQPPPTMSAEEMFRAVTTEL
uniref:Uncharacterized protein n=1 Tax=Peronospora matthiolae TaxID=2874970 RepID=A0AAV1TW91_9STRA